MNIKFNEQHLSNILIHLLNINNFKCLHNHTSIKLLIYFFKSYSNI